MANTIDKIKLKHQDGSEQEVQVVNITDPELKKEVEALKQANNLILNGDVVKLK